MVVNTPAPCKVPRFKTGTQTTIESWFYQMENYLEVNRVEKGQWDKICIAKFHSQHFDQIRRHRYIPYKEFKMKIVELFKRPDLVHFKSGQLMEAVQEENELPDALLKRIRTLTQEAFRKLADEEQQMIAVTAFCKGLRNRQVADLVSAQARESISKAVHIACETESNLEQQFPTDQSQRPHLERYSTDRSLLMRSNPKTERHRSGYDAKQEP